MIDYSDRKYDCIPRLLSQYFSDISNLHIKKYDKVDSYIEKYGFIYIQSGFSCTIYRKVLASFLVNPRTREVTLEFRYTLWHPILTYKSIKLFKQFVIDYLNKLIEVINDQNSMVTQFINDIILEIENKKIKIIKLK